MTIDVKKMREYANSGKCVLRIAQDDMNELLDRLEAAERAVIDTCDQGHRFAKLPDHPTQNAGQARCPHCLVQGMQAVRDERDALRVAVEDAMDKLFAEK